MTRGRYVSGEDINRVNRLAREQTARIEALEAAARAVTTTVIRSPHHNGGKGECAGCWSSWGDAGSSELAAWHYADCPVAALAALLAEGQA